MFIPLGKISKWTMVGAVYSVSSGVVNEAMQNFLTRTIEVLHSRCHRAPCSSGAGVPFVPILRGMDGASITLLQALSHR